MNVETLIAAFQKNNITAKFLQDRANALNEIVKLVPPGSSVAFAGSQTMVDIGARKFFIDAGNRYTIINPYEDGITPEESYARRRMGLTADVLLTGTNAITMKGQIVNIDGSGNRVAGLCFGPKKVIIAVGINKIVGTIVDANKRISNIAAPLNSKRLKKGNPCEKSGKCESCGLPTRICRKHSMIDGETRAGRMHVIIINEELGM